MKFEYDEEKYHGPAIAAIHRGGCILIQTGEGVVAFGGDGIGDGAFHEGKKIGFWSDSVVKSFYPGDKITITF